MLDPRLPQRLEVLRALVGHPIAIRSGYRCPTHNRAVGGAPHSQHLLGKAADLYLGAVKVSDARKAGFNGIGKQGEWAVHVDVRSPPRAEWDY